MTPEARSPGRGPGAHAVVVGVESREQRRRFDPTAWVVLEELLLDATIEGGSATAAVSVRSIAASLSLSKDTVAAAMRRLARAGLVSRVAARDPESGCFGRSSYEVDFIRAGLGTMPASGPTIKATAPTTPTRPRPQQSPTPHPHIEQLSLLTPNPTYPSHIDPHPTSDPNNTLTDLNTIATPPGLVPVPRPAGGGGR